MIKLGAVSTNTWGIPIPNYVEDVILLRCGEMIPHPCGIAGAQARL